MDFTLEVLVFDYLESNQKEVGLIITLLLLSMVADYFVVGLSSSLVFLSYLSH